MDHGILNKNFYFSTRSVPKNAQTKMMFASVKCLSIGLQKGSSNKPSDVAVPEKKNTLIPRLVPKDSLTKQKFYIKTASSLVLKASVILKMTNSFNSLRQKMVLPRIVVIRVAIINETRGWLKESQNVLTNQITQGNVQCGPDTDATLEALFILLKAKKEKMFTEDVHPLKFLA